MAKLTYDPEMVHFCADFLASAREMKAGIKARSTQVNLPPVVIASNKSGLT